MGAKVWDRTTVVQERSSILGNIANLNSSSPYITFQPAAMIHDPEIVLALDLKP